MRRRTKYVIAYKKMDVATDKICDNLQKKDAATDKICDNMQKYVCGDGQIL
jgi:hypothetical protein